ncbi:MAG: uridine kinase [Oscillospiraceae bacterium]|nr:uridine kinase [Oscillospiraceae bacterium]
MHWVTAGEHSSPLHVRIQELLHTHPKVLLAIDGPCASGKTTLTRALQQTYDCNIFPMDHFFLPPTLRTEARLTEPGGNIDYERFQAEVLTPLTAGNPVTYRPYNCQISDFDSAITVPPKQLNIIEGTYSLHPALADAYHLKLFLTTPKAEQLRRIAERDGEILLERFKTEWIPLEKQYFSHFDIESQCDFSF